MDINTTPPALLQLSEDEDTNKILPEKSKERYEHKYSAYCTWRSEYGASQTTEDVFVAYLTERSIIVNPASLWGEHSMLKIMIKLRENVDIQKMDKVQSFMKQNMQTYTPKKSNTLTNKECIQFLKDAPDDMYLMMKVALIIGIHGACRRYEMTNLKMEHLKICDDYLVVTIQQTKNEILHTFTVPNSIIDGIQMAEVVKRYISLRPFYTPHNRLFVSYANGKCTTKPIGTNTFAKIPAMIAQYLKLPDANMYTAHCFRQTSFALLANAEGWKSSTVAEEDIDQCLSNKTNLFSQILQPDINQPHNICSQIAAVTKQVKLEKTGKKMTYEEHLPGSSTPPPSVQDIVLSPITIEPKEEEDFEYAENDERIHLLLNNKFSFLQEQLPLKITDDEYKVMKEIICNDDVFRDATLQTKVHCTVCDTHLGSSPVAQFNRFVHPILNTLCCEFCFVSYNNTEFTKDEDGIEMYCKWCAQDGTVMCCSDCPLVFCNLCVDRNFGERVWEKIANADIWLCFKCNPRQLSKLHIMCSALHEYTLKIIEKAMITGDKALLEIDISICCKYTSTTTNKRKHIVLDDDLDDIPIGKRMEVSNDLNESLPTSRFIIADKKNTSSTSVKLRAIPTDQLQARNSITKSTKQNCSSFSDASKVNASIYRKILPKTSLPASPQLSSIVPYPSPQPLVPAISLSLKYPVLSQDPPPFKPVISVISKVEGNVGSATNESNTNTDNRALLKNALDKSQEVMYIFSRQCETMREAITISKNDAQYAELRNSLQNALYQCSNILLEARQIATSSNTNNTKITAGVLPAKSVPLVNSNVKYNSTVISQADSRTIGNIVPSLMVSASKNNMYVKNIGVKETKTADRDPLAMSDDESERTCIKTEIDTFIDEPIMVKIEEDEAQL